MSYLPTEKQEYKKERLFSYALWYTGKYRISQAKLLEKLKSKSTNETLIQEILVQILPYHSDSVEIRSHIDGYLARAKPLSYIIRSLRQKLFVPEEIKTILEEYDQFDEYENFASTIEKRIKQLISRGNGPKGIQSDLTQKYPQFKGQIESRCNEMDESELLGLLNISDVHLQTPKELKKLQDTLIRKGFSYQQVGKYLREISDT